MAYIWTNYSKEKKYRMASCGISPYIEVWNSEEEIVFVNIDIILPHYALKINVFDKILFFFRKLFHKYSKCDIISWYICNLSER